MEPTLRKPIDNSGKVKWLDLIQSELKKYEGRLANKIQEWDLYVGKQMIFFTDEKEVTVEITSLPVFRSFGDAYNVLGSELVPVPGVDREIVEEFYRDYYTDKDVAQYGVVAIGVRVIDTARVIDVKIIEFPFVYETWNDEIELRTVSMNYVIKYLQYNDYPQSVTSTLENEKLYEIFRQNIPQLEWLFNQLVYIQNLPEDVRNYISRYTNYGSSSINSALRSSTRRSNLYLDLQNAILQSPRSTKPFIVFRAVKTTDYIKGDIFLSKGFLSTSLDCVDVVEKSIRHPGYTILRITVHANTPCLYVEGKSETEVLFCDSILIKVLSFGDVTYHHKEKSAILPTYDLEIESNSLL